MFTKISAYLNIYVDISLMFTYLLILIIYVDISLMFTKIPAYLNNIC